MTPWPSPKHLSAWGGVAPGCRESGGKYHRAATRKGNPYVCTTLVECAGEASHVKDSHLADTYRRLCARTGSKMKARVALGRKVLIIVYHVLSKLEPFHEPNPAGASPAKRQRSIRKHLRELERLGYPVSNASNC